MYAGAQCVGDRRADRERSDRLARCPRSCSSAAAIAANGAEGIFGGSVHGAAAAGRLGVYFGLFSLYAAPLRQIRKPHAL